MIRAAAVALALVGTAAVAHADPPGLTLPAASPQAQAPGASFTPPGMVPLASVPVDQPAGTQDTGSYRAQTLLADGAAVALFVIAVKDSQGGEPLAEMSLATYALGAPIVHLLHHHTKRAAESLALRVGLPVLGAIIGAGLAHSSSSCSGGDDTCDDEIDPAFAAALLGAGAGMITATLIDSIVLAKGDEVSAAPPRFAPTIASRNGAMTFGVGGAF